AGSDVTLADATAAIYTAGRKTAPAAGFLGAPAGAVLGEFPTDGGDIEIRAGHDVVAPVPTETTSAWLFRYGATNWGSKSASGDTTTATVAQQTSWSVVFPNFQQGVGALGGGDVRVSAGNDVKQLAVAIPTTGQLATPVGGHASAADLVVQGGGDLDLTAGRDILGGLFVLGRGHADLRAGRNVAAGAPAALRVGYVSAQRGNPTPVGILIGLADATATVTAGSNVYFEGAFDPMRQGQILQNLVGQSGSAFWGYSDRTALDVTALGGSLRYENDPWASTDLSLSNPATAYQVAMQGGGSDTLSDSFSRAPPTLRLASFSSTLTIEDHFQSSSTLTLASAPRGTLELLASGDVWIARNIAEDDRGALYQRGALDPFAIQRLPGGDTVQMGVIDNVASNTQRGAVPVHLGDPEPARVYSLDGSVCLAGNTQACVPGLHPLIPAAVYLALPKPIEVIAGQDIVRGYIQPQNNSAQDVSSLVAGRDVYEPIVEISGPGTLVLQAGRNVVFGQEGTQPSSQSLGGAVYSLGNVAEKPLPDLGGTDFNRNGLVVNSALPAGKAANVVITAGAAPTAQADANATAFAAAYLDPSNSAQRAVHDYLPSLRSYMAGLDANYGNLSDADLVAAFAALPLVRRQIFLDQVYFTELKETGIDYNDPKSPRFQSYDRGFRAVNLLFPQDAAHPLAGDVILSGKSVQTRADADITILAPHGGVQVGAAIVPSFFNEGAYGGVLTRRGGDIRIMADQDIALYTSRVFTLQGGDITMWSSNGGVSAGSGSKTSVFQKPLAYTMTSEAGVDVDAFGLATGAGIGVLDALDDAGDRPPSRLDIIAPHGEVNAGDAGIRVVGNINIAAHVVVGVENIQVSGVAVGVPKVDAPNLGALTTASQVAQAAAKQGVGPEAQPSTALADLPSIITVEVAGYETTDPSAAEDPKKKRGAK
ncbi:MAG TPA: filamentous hemagglutinin family protein, partial [Anaeromyxobacter sp.]|nr:filamentous hemagglutinin family protein [Anaeromyxobacter sp.]